MADRYRRNIDELAQAASMFWSQELADQEAEQSIIPLLLRTQDQFLAILGAGAPTLDNLFTILDATTMPANLFVKHLIVLADFGGESFKRLSSEFKRLFPDYQMRYVWDGQEYTYTFRYLPAKKLNNTTLRADGKHLATPAVLSDRYHDAIAILLFGNASYSATSSNFLARCQIGDYLGRPQELKRFVSERYIWVSRITNGARSNSLGHLAQNYVADYIEDNLNLRGARIQKDGTIPGIAHSEQGTGTTFDIIVSRGKRYAAVEVTFQETTNSVIERKAGQAQARFQQIEARGHKIAYVIDGAGNFERRSAVSILCNYSHCTVAFSPAELNVLCEFLREHLS